MTNWVTVKVPEDDRDKAKDYRPDGATYGDCLVAGAERLNDHLDSEPPPGARDVQLGEGYQEIAEHIAAALEVDFPTADVKEAVRDVLREELGR